MACFCCASWQEDDESEWKDGPSARMGSCTLYPTWQETKGDHFCSHFRIIVRAYGEGSDLAQREVAITRWMDMYHSERAKRIRLVKVAKELRTKLRAKP